MDRGWKCLWPSETSILMDPPFQEGICLALTSIPFALLTWVCWVHAKMILKLTSKIVEKSCKAFPNWLCCLCLPSWAMQYHYDKAPKCLGDGGVVRSPLCLSGSQMNNLYGELEKTGNEKVIVIFWVADYLWAWKAMQQAFQSNSIGMNPSLYLGTIGPK